MRFSPVLLAFMDYHIEVSSYFSEFCESSQNSRGCPMYMALFLNSNCFDILMFVWGQGRLSQGERRGKEKSFKEKESPYDRYVLGVNPQSA